MSAWEKKDKQYKGEGKEKKEKGSLTPWFRDEGGKKGIVTHLSKDL